jgi:hypothetical protein
VPITADRALGPPGGGSPRLRRRGHGAHLKLVIAKLKRERFGRSAERGSKLLDQLELQA